MSKYPDKLTIFIDRIGYRADLDEWEIVDEWEFQETWLAYRFVHLDDARAFVSQEMKKLGYHPTREIGETFGNFGGILCHLMDFERNE